jgi:hypothetical protein
MLDHGLGILAGRNALRTVSAPPDVQFMPRKRYCDVGSSCSVAHVRDVLT